jgi:colicin import membrane protein
MNAPSLQRLTILSLLFHFSFFVAAFLILKQSSHFVMPSPYIVNLVDADAKKKEGGGAPEVLKQPPEQPLQAVKKPQAQALPKEKSTTQKPKITSKVEEQLLSERIAALKAQKNIEKIVNLRNVVSLKKTGGDGRADASPGTQGKGEGSIMADYYSRITKEIWQHWVFPETGDKNLEAIISIRIMKDGSVQISRIEKSSGNPLFDRSALRAITKATPLPHPPYEMEIGVRFYP